MNNDTQEKLLVALLAPTIETMRRAGIARMAIDGNAVTLQLATGEVTKLDVVDPLKNSLGTLIAWLNRELGDDAVKRLHDMLNA